MSQATRKLKVILGAGMSRVVDAETGEDMFGVTDVNITIDASTNFHPVAAITILTNDIEAERKEQV